MKRVFRDFLINFFGFLIISNLLPAIDFSGRIEIMIFASLALSLVNFLVKPLLNLLLLPLNLITLGAFRWIINIISLFLVTLIIPGFKIKSFVFQGVNYQGFVIPPANIGLFWSYLIISFILRLISDIICAVFK